MPNSTITALERARHLIASDKFPFKLADLQVSDILEAIPAERFAWNLEVGCGKTPCSTMTALAWDENHTIVAVPPIIIDSWAAWLKLIGETDIGIYRGPRRTQSLLNHKWVLMSHAIFRDSFETIQHFYTNKSLSLIVDECFVAGTPILTRNGHVPIEELEVGQPVMTSSGEGVISHVSKKYSTDIYVLEFSNGKSITCTGSHPIFSDSGWVSARDCCGRRVLCHPALRFLPKGVLEKTVDSNSCYEKSNRDWSDLFQILWDETESRTPSRGLCPEWAEQVRSACKGYSRSGAKEKTIEPRTQGAGFKDAEGNGTPTFGSWGERYRDIPVGKVDFRGLGKPGFPVELRSVARDQNARIPDVLQAGLREPKVAPGGRGGRNIASNAGQAGTRREEGSKTETTWLECTSVKRQESGGEVWNIEVPGCPHYFAGGVLVHNCQHIKNPQSKLFKCVYKLAQPDRRIQLLTGTPTSKPQDTYAYMRIKTPNLYRSYGHWQNMHVDEVDIFKTITKYKNLDLLAENFAIKAVKRTKQEIFGHNLDPIFQPMEYELAPKHAALYKKLAEEQLLLLDNGDKIDATTAQRLRHALQQIVCNYGKFSGNPEHVSSAYELLDQVIEEVDPMDQSKSKLVIWTYYVATSEAVTAYLRDKYGVEAVAAAYGKVDSNKGVEAIMHNPKCRFLVAQPSSAGVGLNLHHVCSEMLFLEMSTSPMQVRQAIGRTDRVGQKVRPTIRFGQAKGTIQLKLFQDLLKNDTLVTQVERTKKSLRDEIFGLTA